MKNEEDYRKLDVIFDASEEHLQELSDLLPESMTKIDG